MKTVIYREIIEIDGVVYTVSTRNYSDSVNEWERDEMVGDNRDIINMIIDDIVNAS